ncbi:DUF5615 family PIN-like protein [Streptomyces sp. B21-106]
MQRALSQKETASTARATTSKNYAVAVNDQVGSADMYNLTVDDLHTYYVLAGETPVLVHNSNCPAADAAAGMKEMPAKRAGFTGNGQRIIVDENMSPKFAEQLRGAGCDARSVSEMGLNGTKDPQLMKFAENVNARVLTMDRGRQMDGGFGSRAIPIDRRVASSDGVLRILGGG